MPQEGAPCEGLLEGVLDRNAIRVVSLGLCLLGGLDLWLYIAPGGGGTAPAC